MIEFGVIGNSATGNQRSEIAVENETYARNHRQRDSD